MAGDWRDTFSSARIKVIQKQPYYAEALMRLRLVVAPGIGTLGVDEHWRIGVDPVVVSQWGVDGTAAVLSHEIEHLLRDHPGRKGGRDMSIANVAGDMEINDNVIAAGWKFPKDPKTGKMAGVFASDFGLPNGMLMEEYYDAILSQQQGGGQGGKSPGGGSGKSQPQRQRNDDDDDDDRDDDQQQRQQQQGDEDEQSGENEQPDHSGGKDKSSGGGDRKPDQQEMPGNGCCGSCGGKRQKWEDDIPETDKPGKADRGEQEILRRRTAESIRRTEQSARGTVPAGLVRWAEAELEPPKVDWRAQLRAMVRSAVASKSGADMRTWRRLSARYHSQRARYGNGAVPKPSYYSPVPRVVVEVDLSGSMLASMGAKARTRVDAALPEVLGVARALGVPVDVIGVDAAIQSRKKVRTKAHVVEVASKGYGGTDMRVGFYAALEMKPDVVVIITDGETPWPSAIEIPQRVRLIACIVNDNCDVPEHIKHVVRVTE